MERVEQLGSVREERCHGARQEWRQDDHAALEVGDDAAVQSQDLFQLLAICGSPEDVRLRIEFAADSPRTPNRMICCA